MNGIQETTDKRRQLRKHKQLATGLFLLMAGIYILMIWLMQRTPANWMGYVKAFSEAAMVGALADWFAVTALFHHPLGLPIPHTNLIEKSKQSIGNNLGSFVVDNFLTPQNIRPYIQKLTISAYAGTWLSSQRNKALVTTETIKLLKDIVLKMDDELVVGFIAKKGNELVGEVKLNQVVAGGLQYFIDRGEDEKLITALASKLKSYVSQNETMVQERVKKESYFFVPKFIDNKLASKITNGLIRYFDEIGQDKEHKIRKELAQQLGQFVAELRNGEKWTAELQRLKDGLLSEEHIKGYAADIWLAVKRTMTEELSAEDSALSRYIFRTLDEFAASLQQDEALRQRIDGWIRHTAYKYILRNTENVGLLISNTVGNWQGRELSAKLELEVGKDLQFIRINGTLVGGLVGLLIYTVTQLLS